MGQKLSYPSALALTALALGISADLLFYEQLPGISLPIFVALCLGVLAVLARVEGRPAAPYNRWLGLASIFFAILTAIRADPTLVAFNAIAALGLLLLQVGLFRGLNLATLPGGEYLVRPFVALGELCFRPFGPLIRGIGALLSRSERFSMLMPVGRGLMLAAPIVGVFTVLLMMADSVFASLVIQVLTLQLPIQLGDLVAHTAVVGGVTWVCGGALLVALRAEQAVSDQIGPPTFPKPWGLGCVEGMTVLVSIDLLFGGFMLIQAAYLFGGLDTLAQTRMTYADYARRGFFELLAVAALTLGVLWMLVRATRREATWQGPAFNAAAAILIMLTVGLLSSAFQRMWLYEQAYGFTHLRIYTHTFMIWLALALLLFLAALLANRPHWFSFGAFSSALVVMALLTLANPEAIIVRANVQRYLVTGAPELLGTASDPDAPVYREYRRNRELDTGYLTELSTDATPALVELLPALPIEQQAAIREKLVQQREWLEQIEAEGWQPWHLSRAQALAAIHSLAAH
jgi:Domain of unknown function (DUF4173)